MNVLYEKKPIKLWRDAKGNFRFDIVARNGKILNQSKGFSTLANLKGNIEALRKALVYVDADTAFAHAAILLDKQHREAVSKAKRGKPHASQAVQKGKKVRKKVGKAG